MGLGFHHQGRNVGRHLASLPLLTVYLTDPYVIVSYDHIIAFKGYPFINSTMQLVESGLFLLCVRVCARVCARE